MSLAAHILLKSLNEASLKSLEPKQKIVKTFISTQSPMNSSSSSTSTSIATTPAVVNADNSSSVDITLNKPSEILSEDSAVTTAEKQADVDEQTDVKGDMKGDMKGDESPPGISKVLSEEFNEDAPPPLPTDTPSSPSNTTTPDNQPSISPSPSSSAFRRSRLPTSPKSPSAGTGGPNTPKTPNSPKVGSESSPEANRSPLNRVFNSVRGTINRRRSSAASDERKQEEELMKTDEFRTVQATLLTILLEADESKNGKLAIPEFLHCCADNVELGNVISEILTVPLEAAVTSPQKEKSPIKPRGRSVGALFSKFKL